MRADQLLVARGMAASRTLARRLIEAGRVRCQDRLVARPSEPLANDARLSVAPGEEDRYVSRGGLKLAGALERVGLAAEGLVCLDVGQSTGGFTDCLLQAGASAVVGVDVGHQQLHPRIRQHPRVTAIEGLNARSISSDCLGEAMPAAGFGLIAVDLSFISLKLVIAGLYHLASVDGQLLALVKPQFELGRQALDHHGIVRDPSLFPAMRESITSCALNAGWKPEHWFESPIRGGDGNLEFFMHAVRESPVPGTQS
ncbi:MAG: TlyA family RNA methyltransferase [Quisquiliibacterium sp.]